MKVAAYQIVTFAGAPFLGNPAFVVTLDGKLPDDMLSDICAELRADVLAVIVPNGDELGLSFATPNGPHSGAGHATHAAAWVALNRLRPGARELAFRLADGDMRQVRCDSERVAVDWPVMPFEVTDEGGILEKSLGQRPKKTLASPFGTVAIFESEEAVKALSPDLERIAKLEANSVIVTAPGQRSDFVIRVFAPKLGLPEDPVCGTAHRIIVPFWAKQLGRTTLVSHQLSARSGELFCDLRKDVVTIAGLAAPFLEGVIQLAA